MTEKILFVDDEQSVLDAFRRQWHRRFDIEVADSGKEGLRVLEEKGPFAVVVTDMRMPEMDGIQFLKEVQRVAPHSVRLMLTGNADQQTAIDAVNEGKVFRFLNKPCPNEVMLSALEASIRQYRLETAERELIEGTLKSSINLVMDMLSLNSAVDFSLRGSVLERARTMARALAVKDLWQMEVAAMLSNIAHATLPSETRDKLHQGQTLSDTEREIVQQLPVETHKLLHNIPRLQRVARIVLYQAKNFDGSGVPADEVKGGDLPIESRILRIVHDLSDLQKARQIGIDEALKLLQDRVGAYDPDILAMVVEQFEGEDAGRQTGQPVDVMVDELAPGQVLESNIETLDGRVLVKAGTELNGTRIKSVLNYHKINRIRQPVVVRKP